jgi:hypothetical protein
VAKEPTFSKIDSLLLKKGDYYKYTTSVRPSKNDTDDTNSDTTNEVHDTDSDNGNDANNVRTDVANNKNTDDARIASKVRTNDTNDASNTNNVRANESNNTNTDDASNANNVRTDDANNTNIDEFDTIPLQSMSKIWVRRLPNKNRELLQKYDSQIEQQIRCNEPLATRDSVEVGEDSIRELGGISDADRHWMTSEEFADTDLVNLKMMCSRQPPKIYEKSFLSIHYGSKHLPCLFCSGNRLKPQGKAYSNIDSWYDIKEPVQKYPKSKLMTHFKPADDASCNGFYFLQTEPDDVATPTIDSKEMNVKHVIQEVFRFLLTRNPLSFHVMVGLHWQDQVPLKIAIGRLIGKCRQKIGNMATKLRARVAFSFWEKAAVPML